MTVRVNKSSFNIREKLSELERPIGLKGSELMKAETAQEARDFVSAGRKNLIINGAMEVSQRGTSNSGLTSGSTYTTDRFRLAFSDGGGGTWTLSQESDGPPGFQKSVKAECTSGYTDTTDNYVTISQTIEGYILNHLAFGTSSAKPITISFWVKCSKAGPRLICEIYKGRNFTRLININSANTWEYKTVTVDGDTAAGFLNTTNGAGGYLNFFFGLGTDYKLSAMNTTWSEYSVGARGTGLQNLNSTGDTIQITGVQLEVGRNATEFEHRSYGEELALCQRYYVAMGPQGKTNYVNEIGVGYCESNLVARGYVQFPTTMRSNPTVTSDQLEIRTITGLQRNMNSPTFETNENGVYIDASNTGFTAGAGGLIRLESNAGKLEADAEL